MAFKFREHLGMGVPCTIVALNGQGLLAVWWGSGAWQWAHSKDGGASFSAPGVLTSIYPADASDASDDLHLRSVTALTVGIHTFLVFRHYDPYIERGDGASCLVRVCRATYTAGTDSWTFIFSLPYRCGLDNMRINNHTSLPDIAYDETNSLIHLVVVREPKFTLPATQSIRLHALNFTTLEQVYTAGVTGPDPVVDGRLTAVALACKVGGRIALVFSCGTSGVARLHPRVLAGAVSYANLGGQVVCMTNLLRSEKPIVACAYEDNDVDDYNVRVYGLGVGTITTALWESQGENMGAEDSVGTTDSMESLDAARSVNGFVFAHAGGFKKPRFRVNNEALIADDKLEMPVGVGLLPFRTIIRTAPPPQGNGDTRFAKGTYVTVSDLLLSRIYSLQWDAVPLQPIDLSPDNGTVFPGGVVTLRARYLSQEELIGKLTFEISSDENFTVILQTLDAVLLQDGQMGTVVSASILEGTLYWRVKGNIAARGDGVYSETRNFIVSASLDTITPEDGLAIDDGGAVLLNVTLSATVRVIAQVTARAEFQIDRADSFITPDLISLNGPYVLNGIPSTVSLDLPRGIWFFRVRSKTLTGSPSGFYKPQAFRTGTSGDTRSADSSAAPYRQIESLPTVSERAQDIVNHVIVKVRNSAIEVVRESDPAPAANRRREHVIWIESGDEAIASQVARDFIAANSNTKRSIDGITIPLTPDIELDRGIRVSGVPGLPNGVYKVQSVTHDLASFRTTLQLGDYSPTSDQAIARLADRLERTRAEEKSG